MGRMLFLLYCYLYKKSFCPRKSFKSLNPALFYKQQKGGLARQVETHFIKKLHIFMQKGGTNKPQILNIST